MRAFRSAIALFFLLLGSSLRLDAQVEDYLYFIPAAFDLGAGIAGLPSERNFIGRGIEAVWAFGTVAVTTKCLKSVVRSTRPDESDDKSFPSGHTGIAFTGAELVRMEYGWGWGAGAYAVAASVAGLRLAHSRHRFIDVLAGAGLGILSAHVGDLLTGPTERLLGIDHPGQLSVSVIPQHAPGTLSLVPSASFHLSF